DRPRTGCEEHRCGRRDQPTPVPVGDRLRNRRRHRPLRRCGHHPARLRLRPSGGGRTRRPPADPGAEHADRRLRLRPRRGPHGSRGREIPRSGTIGRCDRIRDSARSDRCPVADSLGTLGRILHRIRRFPCPDPGLASSQPGVDRPRRRERNLMNAGPNDAHGSQSTPAEATAASLRGRVRPLPAETDEETFLPFLDLCFNWSMDKPRIDIAELRERTDAAFYYRDWGRHGDIAVAAHAEADPESPIIGLAWVRLADIADVVGRADARTGGDFAAALDKSGADRSGPEVVRSEVVPADTATVAAAPAEASADSPAEASDGESADAPAQENAA